MTIGQMISKQTDDFDSVNINYTDENGIPWHIQLPFEKAKNCDAIMQCGYQTFKKSYCGRKIIGIFDVVSNNLPEDATQKSDFIFPKTSEPARKSNPESDEITVQDYLNTQSDIKKIAFSLNTTIGCWYTDTINVQELPETMSSLMNLFVDNVKVSDSDESVFQMFVLTKELENWREQESKKEREEQKMKNLISVIASCITSISTATLVLFFGYLRMRGILMYDSVLFDTLLKIFLLCGFVLHFHSWVFNILNDLYNLDEIITENSAVSIPLLTRIRLVVQIYLTISNNRE